MRRKMRFDEIVRCMYLLRLLNGFSTFHCLFGRELSDLIIHDLYLQQSPVPKRDISMHPTPNRKCPQH
jgi:hypothetical protein